MSIIRLQIMRGYRNKQRCWHLPEYAAQRRSGVARGAARRAHCQLEGEGGRRRTRGLREMARCRPARLTCAAALALSLLAVCVCARNARTLERGPLAVQLVRRLALHELRTHGVVPPSCPAALSLPSAPARGAARGGGGARGRAALGEHVEQWATCPFVAATHVPKTGGESLVLELDRRLSLHQWSSEEQCFRAMCHVGGACVQRKGSILAASDVSVCARSLTRPLPL